jgi:hypothetical protein
VVKNAQVRDGGGSGMARGGKVNNTCCRVHNNRKAIAVAQEQYTSLLTGLQAVGQVKGWTVQQLVFVGGTCGSVHVESFNKNMKALGVLESKWDLIRQKLVRRLLEEQDKVLRSYFAQKGGARSQRGEGIQGKGREHVKWDMYA